METYVLRLWLPDRPGALGAVASRIGAVKGDVVGIEILETGQGQAVDELVVQLPDSTLVDLLIGEVRQVDGVEVEEVRRLGSARYDRPPSPWWPARAPPARPGWRPSDTAPSRRVS